MKLVKSLLVTGLIATLSFGALANADSSNKLKTMLTAKLGLSVSSVKPMPIDGLFEVMTDRGIFYSSQDGRYIMRGNIFDTVNGFTNLTEGAMAKMRNAKLESYASSMIVYPAKDEQYTVTVFTDVDCGYCRRLHSQMQQYNDLGITVRYMAYPRGGQDSKTWASMESLWCSSDQRKAMDDLKSGTEIAQSVCPNRIPDHYQLGVEFGVTGTPAIVLDDGTLIPGYQPPAKLLEVLKS
ncbi:bifunctional protein-disulfide isomerase/oxidoreductase DsbC [Psychrobium sp. 1_MG-2023]|uniref:bifunctional protein-disulfide isomerase/oxidoreductase DsbC n=1 Tax=Psychrobium sp. 1_MG-2023 TaxID=3062624 RepID=UPI000C34548D|nr:bifunctional protein-disulfide isomerase/oxidoreductase DsbC [Psychrobium sp. 1_MG-2023]MDP2560649.1 bifunctional protein-disulfide isomerase/oxidoreductase DsbC [Psychrobium sp. 1_MG-2023]PKF56546.1 bifunctional protein-disulfide isomerase/oxidoreductase DsbC [Alteromonadales bacterium alter-6D02]